MVIKILPKVTKTQLLKDLTIKNSKRIKKKEYFRCFEVFYLFFLERVDMENHGI